MTSEKLGQMTDDVGRCREPQQASVVLLLRTMSGTSDLVRHRHPSCTAASFTGDIRPCAGDSLWVEASAWFVFG